MTKNEEIEKGKRKREKGREKEREREREKSVKTIELFRIENVFLLKQKSG